VSVASGSWQALPAEQCHIRRGGPSVVKRLIRSTFIATQPMSVFCLAILEPQYRVTSFDLTIVSDAGIVSA